MFATGYFATGYFHLDYWPAAGASAEPPVIEELLEDVLGKREYIGAFNMNPFLVLKPVAEVYGTTVGNTITSLPSIPRNAAQALVQIETGPIRARFDGTASVTNGVGGGILMGTTSNYYVEGWDNMNRMRMVSNSTTTAAMINVLYLGEGQPS